MLKRIKESKNAMKILICTILICISVSIFGQDPIKRTNKDIVLKAFFKNDTLDLTGSKDIIIDFEIKNNSDSVFLFNPNAYVNITEKIDEGLSLDKFGILLDLTTKTEKIIEILPDSLICFSSKFNLQDKNVSVISMSALYERNHDFSIAYIPHFDDINRIVLFSEDINVTVIKKSEKL